MPCARFILLVFLLVSLSGCSSYQPVWKPRAFIAMEHLKKEGAGDIRPEAYQSLIQTYEQAEMILKHDDDAELADQLYLLAFQKSTLLEQELRDYKTCIEEETRLFAIEEENLRQAEELEKKRLESIEAIKNEKKKKEALSRQKQKEGASDNGASHREKNHHPSSYIVKRGETLPQIAARPEVYNDASLWQLIYRANRDQVRDPYQLWPGQILKIPKNSTSR